MVYRNNFLLSNRGETGSHLVSLRLLGGESPPKLITSELANQCVRKVLFTCVVPVSLDTETIIKQIMTYERNVMVYFQPGE